MGRLVWTVVRQIYLVCVRTLLALLAGASLLTFFCLYHSNQKQPLIRKSIKVWMKFVCLFLSIHSHCQFLVYWLDATHNMGHADGFDYHSIPVLVLSMVMQACPIIHAGLTVSSKYEKIQSNSNLLLSSFENNLVKNSLPCDHCENSAICSACPAWVCYISSQAEMNWSFYGLIHQKH